MWSELITDEGVLGQVISGALIYWNPWQVCRRKRSRRTATPLQAMNGHRETAFDRFLSNLWFISTNIPEPSGQSAQALHSCLLWLLCNCCLRLSVLGNLSRIIPLGLPSTLIWEHIATRVSSVVISEQTDLSRHTTRRIYKATRGVYWFGSKQFLSRHVHCPLRLGHSLCRQKYVYWYRHLLYQS